MLDAYLNSLNKEEKEKTASQARFGAASVVELAKMAGLELGEQVCTNCGDTMTKLGSVYKCGCGMMKKAKKKIAEAGQVDPGWWESQKGMSRAMRRSDEGVGQVIADPELTGQRFQKGLLGGAAGGGLGAGVGALGAALLKKSPRAGAMLGSGWCHQSRPGLPSSSRHQSKTAWVGGCRVHSRSC